MKIYLVSLQFLGTISGGEGVHVTELARELVRKNIDTTVLTIGIRNQKHFEEVTLHDPYDKSLKSNKIPVHRFFCSDSAFINNGNDGTSIQIKNRVMEFLLQVLGFLRGQANQENSIVHLHGHYLIPSLSKELKHSTRFKVISSIHRAESIYEEKGILNENPQLLQLMEEKELNAINYSDYVIVRSNYIKDLLLELYQNRITNNKIEVLPSAVSMPFINEPIPSKEEIIRIKERIGIKGDLILSLNVIEPLKAFEYIIQSIPLLFKKLKMNKLTDPVTIIIAGHLSDNHIWYYNKLLKGISRIVNLRQRKSIRIMTNIDTATRKDLYHVATVFLHTAIAEPFGITIAEALVKNNIVVATDAEGPRLILDYDGSIQQPLSLAKYGIIFPMHDMSTRCENITESLIYALKNKESLKSMSKSAHDHVIHNFSWDSLINKKIQLYKKLLEKK